MGLGSALSEKEGAVSSPPFLFYCKNTSKWHGLEGKNIYCAGCFGGTGDFDVGSFGSCTVGSIKIGGPGGTNISSVKWVRVSVPAGDYNGLVQG